MKSYKLRSVQMGFIEISWFKESGEFSHYSLCQPEDLNKFLTNAGYPEIDLNDLLTCEKCGQINEFVRFESLTECNICDKCLYELKNSEVLN